MDCKVILTSLRTQTNCALFQYTSLVSDYSAVSACRPKQISVLFTKTSVLNDFLPHKYATVLAGTVVHAGSFLWGHLNVGLWALVCNPCLL